MAWLLLYLLLAAIMMGISGKAWFSNAQAWSPDGPVQIAYRRFMRYGAPNALRFTIYTFSTLTTLELDSNYFEYVDLTEVVPEPDRMLATSESISVLFSSLPKQNIQVMFSITPKKLASMRAGSVWRARHRNPSTRFFILSSF